jgi:hypothetical protein
MNSSNNFNHLKNKENNSMFTGSEKHDIKFAAAGVMTSAYRQSVPAGEIIGGFFGREAIEEILNQHGCVGIRYYYGLDANGQKVLVLVGTDANENDLADEANGHVCMEASIPCPNRCSTANVLNS